MPTQSFRNTILKNLEPDVIERMALRPVEFPVGYEIEFPGKRIERLYFVETGMASQTVTMRNGCQVEVGMFGYESVIGVSALMGTKQSLNRVYPQIAGYAYAATVDVAGREYERCGQFHKLATQYVQAQLVQVMQSAACNLSHSVEQRLARWLLICADRANTETFKLSQEYIASMLGNTRSTVSSVAGLMKAEGLISYTRGEIHLLDVPALKRKACECYQVIQSNLENYAAFGNNIVR